MAAPSKYRSVAHIDGLVDAYIQHCHTAGKAPTLALLPQHLGFHNGDDMRSYFSKNKRFTSALSRARELIEDHWNQLLADKTNKNGNGAYRYCQAAFHYTDKIDVNQSLSRVIRLPGKVKIGSPVALPEQAATKKPVRVKKATSNDDAKKGVSKQ